MPRMQVYLPDDLYAEVKAQELPASELLQQAVRAELRRRALLQETDRYLEELVAEVGAPSARDLAAAEEIVARLRVRSRPGG
jgi:post-segregation antitoxin (ccd killing protein)